MLRLSWLVMLVVALVSGCGPKAAPAAGGASSAETPAPNSVAAYLNDDAEVQVETDAQRAELIAALHDMLSLSAAELKARRYAAYDGTPGVRTLPELLMGHIVPATRQMLEDERFYADVKAPSARAAVELTLERMRLAVSPTSTGAGGAQSGAHE